MKIEVGKEYVTRGGEVVSTAQIVHMVERFLNWKLPENFNPDGGISFERVGNKGTPHEYRREPVGTNLFDAIQAAAMVRYMLEGCRSAPTDEPESLRDSAPIPMLLWCPECGDRHVDEGEFATKYHHTHACQSCGHVWRPAIITTVGVRFLPGFKNATAMMEARKK